ncbi:SpoIIE family protein phosphatase [Streptacidiphilus jiangxiensis]|uniref:protein-serine/threonine phosphatase n=1 Tax=Streptacidiphilus jiangxiensis TaxID=235985 RepID=A0A1H7U7G2_STRJI|nr:SpoIIE family protein phosphatase [Streptacidiphilus jiangxiensis]SEL92676.1 PAS domain S-box-containing protein [Streptacidiphilus jiangxiensis]
MSPADGWAARSGLTRQVMDAAVFGIALLDTELRFTYVNEALAKVNGVPVAEHLGRRIAEVVPGIDVEAAEAELRAVLADGKPRHHTVEGTTAADPSGELRWWHNAYSRLEDSSGRVLGIVGMVLEITEDRRIRQALDRARTRLALLDEAATSIGTTLDVQLTCKELTRLLVPRLTDVAVVDVIEQDERPGSELRLRRLAMSTTPALVKAGRWFGAPGSVHSPQATSVAARCVAEERPIVSNSPGDEQMALAAPEAGRVARYRRLGIHSSLVVPLRARGRVIGVVNLMRAGESPPFTAEDVELVGELARRAANSISNAQRFAHEHETALVLQRALLSERTRPHVDVECAGRYLPAGKTAEVGGDWFDSMALPGGRTLLVVGDVMGHGLEAAASMGEYRSLMRALAFQGWGPEKILSEAQRTVEALGLDRVATCLVAEIDPAAGTVTLAGAGHLPPLLLRRGLGAQFAALPGDPPLGAGVGHYRSTTLRLPPGSVLLLYTDGLVERRGEDIEDSLQSLAALDLDPETPLERLLDTALSRLSVSPAEDDVALLAARLR